MKTKYRQPLPSLNCWWSSRSSPFWPGCSYPRWPRRSPVPSASNASVKINRSDWRCHVWRRFQRLCGLAQLGASTMSAGFMPLTGGHPPPSTARHRIRPRHTRADWLWSYVGQNYKIYICPSEDPTNTLNFTARADKLTTYTMNGASMAHHPTPTNGYPTHKLSGNDSRIVYDLGTTCDQ